MFIFLLLSFSYALLKGEYLPFGGSSGGDWDGGYGAGKGDFSVIHVSPTIRGLDFSYRENSG